MNDKDFEDLLDEYTFLVIDRDPKRFDFYQKIIDKYEKSREPIPIQWVNINED